jgi:hypothetical protein
MSKQTIGISNLAQELDGSAARLVPAETSGGGAKMGETSPREEAAAK